MVVGDPGLVARRRAGRLDAPDEAHVGDDPRARRTRPEARSRRSRSARPRRSRQQCCAVARPPPAGQPAAAPSLARHVDGARPPGHPIPPPICRHSSGRHWKDSGIRFRQFLDLIAIALIGACAACFGPRRPRLPRDRLRRVESRLDVIALAGCVRRRAWDLRIAGQESPAITAADWLVARRAGRTADRAETVTGDAGRASPAVTVSVRSEGEGRSRGGSSPPRITREKK